MKKQLINLDDDDPLPKLKERDFIRFEEKVKMFDGLKRKMLRNKLNKQKQELCLEIVSINKKLKILNELDKKEGVGNKKK